MTGKTILFLMFGAALRVCDVQGADWPCYRGNSDRTGYTAERLSLPMGLAWKHDAPHPPSPAFWDCIINTMFRRNRFATTEASTHDRAYHPVIAAGRLYYGSSTDEAVYCLDAATGQAKWTFSTEGSVRFAPVVAGSRIYFGADDGFVYCLDAAGGAVQWKYDAAPSRAQCIGNNRPISAWPVRGGVIVDKGVVYCAAGVFPEQGVYICALDAATGRQIWRQQTPYIAHGQLLVVDDWLWVPQHRQAPAEFRLSDGTPRVPVRAASRGHGATQLWKIDGMPAWGPTEVRDVVMRLNPRPLEQKEPWRNVSAVLPTGTFSQLDAWTALASPSYFFLVKDDRLLAVDIAAFRRAVVERAETLRTGKDPYQQQREPSYTGPVGLLAVAKEDASMRRRLEKAAAWTRPVKEADGFRAAIVAGDLLILGGSDKVAAFDATTGEPAWAGKVDGTALGLAVADGALYASTDKGKIYCFRDGAATGAIPAEPTRSVVAAFPGDPLYEEAAVTAVQQAGRTKGVCLVLGGGEGHLAYEIARRSEFRVIVFEKDAGRATALRAKLREAGVYGDRVVVRHVPGEELPYPFGFANLVVSDEAVTTGVVPYGPAAVLRLVQPYGGTLVFGARQGRVKLDGWSGEQLSAWRPASGASGGAWQVAQRGELPGGGQWPQHTGNPANTMCTGETLAPDVSELILQWFGPPYTSDIVDRHFVAQPPLFRDGILLVCGATDTLTAMDAYNGTLLWKISQPKSLRMVASHNTGPVACGADRNVFVVTGNECWRMDAITGRKMAAYAATVPDCDWGFVAAPSNFLVGTSQGLQANVLARVGPRTAVGPVDGRLESFKSRPAVSRELFVYDVSTRQKKWTYAGGAILNASIAVADGRIHFAESRNRAGLAETTGSMEMRDFLTADGGTGARIATLDLETGKLLWTRPITRNLDSPHQWLMYLSCSDGLLLATRTYYRQEDDGQFYRGYDFEALDAAGGKTLWTRWVRADKAGEYSPLSYGKNTLSSRPILTGGKIWMLWNLPGSPISKHVSCFDLKTGEPIGKPVPAGTNDKGCSPAIGSARALYYRNWSHGTFDLASGKSSFLNTTTRPACWPNTLPVGGLIISPEGSASCSCGMAFQLSFALAPKQVAAPQTKTAP